MSLKSVLSKIWNSIKSVFSKLPAELKTAVHVGVVVTENMKKFVDSPLADVLTTIIPGDIDDKLKLVLRKGLPIIVMNLKLADGLEGLQDNDIKVAYAIRILQSMEGEIKASFLHSLSILIAQLASDGKLTWGDGATIVQWYYENKFKAQA